jgi:hypothetical protein
MAASTSGDGFQEAQRVLVSRLEAEGGWDIVVGDAFVRGMRDIGYKSTSFALAELIDNSIQAAATRVDMVFGFDGGRMPSKLAIIDDGHGMERQMVRAALIWGAGTRGENRSGFGKYGYGLPSASISQCYRVLVYSKVAGGGWYRAYLDVNEIKQGDPKWLKGNRISMPEEVLESPPSFVVDFLKKEKRWETFDHGTVIVWEDLDGQRIDYKRREELRNKLVTDLGVIYRNYLLATPMTVDGVEVEPCDPLFVTEGFRYYDLDEDRAVELEPANFEVKDKKSGEVIGRMRVRFARMPATFFRKPEFKHTNRPGRGKDAWNERLNIADPNNGIIFLRHGRQIDVVRPPRWLGSINATTDRFWAVEVDFDAELDEYFSITTSKQQITPDDSIWNMLNDKAKLSANIAHMRTSYQKEAERIANEAEQAKQEGARRASVEAVEGAEKYRTTPRPEPTAEREQEAAENLDQEARRRAAKAGVKPEAIERELVAERHDREHDVETEDLPGAPFFRCVQEGGTRVLYLNISHPFYTQLYSGPGTNARSRAGLETLLWTLGNAEVDADPESERRRFYERERASVWSPRLADALEVLKSIKVIEADDEDAAA